MTNRYPKVAEYINSVSETKAEICYFLGKWTGLRYAANERHVDQFSNLQMMKQAIRSVSREDWKETWMEVIGEVMPDNVKAILESLFI